MMAENEEYDIPIGEPGYLSSERMLHDQRLWSGKLDEKLEYRFRQIERRLEEGNRLIEDVKTQATKTNGRLTALEKTQYLMTGGLIVVLAIAVPLFLDMVRSS